MAARLDILEALLLYEWHPDSPRITKKKKQYTAVYCTDCPPPGVFCDADCWTLHLDHEKCSKVRSALRPSIAPLLDPGCNLAAVICWSDL